MQKGTQEAIVGREVRCILFDLGETLWTRTSVDNTLEIAATQRALGIIREHTAPEVFAQADLTLLNEQFYQSVLIKAREFVRSHPGYEPDFGNTINAALTQFGLPQLDRPASEAVFEALRIPILGSRRLFDDTLLTLQALKQRGFLLGVVTNRYWGGQPFLADVEKLGLFEYFAPDTIAISADLGIRKPNPDIFWHTLKALNVGPEDCAMVGDSLYADVNGARRLNMLAVWKPKLHQRAELAALQGDTAQNDDDDSLFSYSLEKDNQKYQQRIQDDAKPDITIEHLCELQDIFIGRQD